MFEPSPKITTQLRIAFVLFLISFGSYCSNAQTEEEKHEETYVPTLDEAWSSYYQGRYENALRIAIIGAELDPWIADWEVIAGKSMLATGMYEQAFLRLNEYVGRRQFELRPRLLLIEAARHCGRTEIAKEQLDALAYLINRRSRRYYQPDDIVAIGEAALMVGIEPKIVLENFFKRMQSETDAPASAFLGSGNLALDKHDYALASRSFQEGLKLHPDNPELWLGLARSYQEDDRSKLVEYTNQALELNSRLPAARILIADYYIAAEAYEESEQQLNQALAVNPLHPEALAYKSVLAYLQNFDDEGDDYRDYALSTWSSNPLVDHTIGRELARKYRFMEGANFQRTALLFDPNYLPARIQLAQDLLRLGRNQEAWEHAHEVHESDPYDIAAFNLVTLHDKLDEFTTISSENFELKLASNEASVYGERAIRLLETAHANLSDRYGIELPQKTQVEIYPDPADFETRTFGMPGNPGFLGVCFGPVFTINSPATRSNNWEAVLYHEFCHTITLTLTNNRMPRWLSEGISVFEEQIFNPSWGQRMTADYRDRILREEMQPISNMSATFLQAGGGEDIQFAYYQSYLVVEYLHQTYGMESIKALLDQLGSGISMNEALSSSLAPLDELDAGFKDFATQKAEQLAAQYRFDKPEGIIAQAKEMLNPRDNYYDELTRTNELIAEEKWDMAIERLESLVQKAGYLPGPENAHFALAVAYGKSGDLDKERETLETIVKNEAHKLKPITRLLEIAKEQKSIADTFKWSNAWLSINPMAETPWRSLLAAATELLETDQAIEAGEALVALDPPDIASIHYALAELYKNSNTRLAKRHTLIALELAPRFQKAYKLLAEFPDETQSEESSIIPKIDLIGELSEFETTEQ